MQIINKVKSLSWIPAILLMILIFYFSQQSVTKSNDLSMGITERIIEIVINVTPMENVTVDKIHHIVRKNAHFFLYFFLGIFVQIGLKRNGVIGSRSFMLALLFSMIFAISDEVHQLFVDGRGAQIKDVLIDCTGATFGITMASIIGGIITKQPKKMPSKRADEKGK